MAASRAIPFLIASATRHSSGLCSFPGVTAGLNAVRSAACGMATVALPNIAASSASPSKHQVCIWQTPSRSAALFAAHARGFRSSSEKLTIVVPSMGDSIVEGTICAVLKGAGDSVVEDETIAQIETDKVTVDVRAPKTGTISSIMVKTDDNVEIGQTVAYLIPGEAPSTAAAVAAVDPPPTVAAATSPPLATAARAASIRFPPRMTPDGQRISSLPAEQQAAFLGQAPSEAAPVALTAPAPTFSAPPRSSERLESQPERYPYSDREMECIMLGGAENLNINISVNVTVEL